MVQVCYGEYLASEDRAEIFLRRAVRFCELEEVRNSFLDEDPQGDLTEALCHVDRCHAVVRSPRLAANGCSIEKCAAACITPARSVRSFTSVSFASLHM